MIRDPLGSSQDLPTRRAANYGILIESHQAIVVLVMLLMQLYILICGPTSPVALQLCQHIHLLLAALKTHLCPKAYMFPPCYHRQYNPQYLFYPSSIRQRWKCFQIHPACPRSLDAPVLDGESLIYFFYSCLFPSFFPEAWAWGLKVPNLPRSWSHAGSVFWLWNHRWFNKMTYISGKFIYMITGNPLHNFWKFFLQLRTEAAPLQIPPGFLILQCSCAAYP